MRRPTFSGWLLMLCVGCQNYDFEEILPITIQEKRWTKSIPVSSAIDILFVVDNSGSMEGEQRQLADSFRAFTEDLEDTFGDDYHIAVVTTGFPSDRCAACDPSKPYDPDDKCINQTGESGVFQDLLGKYEGAPGASIYSFRRDESCSVVTRANKGCFYDPLSGEGTVLVGIGGCGYERGLAALKRALSDDLLADANRGFLRPDATLAIVVITDEEDCGEVGQINEKTTIGGDMCYYAARGTGPGGEALALAPVDETHRFLLGLKAGRPGMVKFAAIVGVRDLVDLSTTAIEFDANGKSKAVCSTGDGTLYEAQPGTRYIALARAFGIEEDGFVDTICQKDFSATMGRISEFVRCPRLFKLTEPILDPDLASILINGNEIPRYSCSENEEVLACPSQNDACPNSGLCLPTWSYFPPDGTDAAAPGGTIRFADHFKPCDYAGAVDQVHIELIYVVSE